jgi:hypothetical protein
MKVSPNGFLSGFSQIFSVCFDMYRYVCMYETRSAFFSLYVFLFAKLLTWQYRIWRTLGVCDTWTHYLHNVIVRQPEPIKLPQLTSSTSRQRSMVSWRRTNSIALFAKRLHGINQNYRYFTSCIFNIEVCCIFVTQRAKPSKHNNIISGSAPAAPLHCGSHLDGHLDRKFNFQACVALRKEVARD